MFQTKNQRAVSACLAPVLALSLLAGCATTSTRDDAPRREPYVTKHDRTLKGAGVGAAAGAVAPTPAPFRVRSCLVT